MKQTGTRARPTFTMKPCVRHSWSLVLSGIMKSVGTAMPMLGVVAFWLGGSAEPATTSHSGMANASAVARLTEDCFVAASDEDNVLRVYRRNSSSGPLAILDVSPHLGLERRHSPEVDLEGAASIGNRVYWIGSHSRSKDGRPRPNRHRLFATEFTTTNEGVQLSFTGRPCTDLIEQMIRSPELSQLQLQDAAQRGPDQGGINVEALAARPDGSLLIGFRSPVPNGKALFIPLLNPKELMEGKPAKFGPLSFVGLDDLGLRDAVAAPDGYYLIAGREGRGGNARLYHWDGVATMGDRIGASGFKDSNPEAIALFGTARKPRLLILSDDGNKSLNERMFRSFSVKP